MLLSQHPEAISVLYYLTLKPISEMYLIINLCKKENGKFEGKREQKTDAY